MKNIEIPKKTFYFSLIGFVIGGSAGVLIFYWALPILVFFGFFGSWLNASEGSMIYWIDILFEHIGWAILVSSVIGFVIGYAIGENKR